MLKIFEGNAFKSSKAVRFPIFLSKIFLLLLLTMQHKHNGLHFSSVFLHHHPFPLSKKKWTMEQTRIRSDQTRPDLAAFIHFKNFSKTAAMPLSFSLLNFMPAYELESDAFLEIDTYRHVQSLSQSQSGVHFYICSFYPKKERGKVSHSWFLRGS